MSANAIARRYAKALVQLAAEEGAVEKFHAELATVEALFTAHPQLSALLTNPAYGIEAKIAILKDLAAKISLSTTISNFLLLLQERSRMSCLSAIISNYSLLADELSGIVRPLVRSAFPLDDAKIAEIRGVLEKNTGKKAVMTIEIDPSLIGGIVTKIGDKVFDGSVKTQLTRIEDILQKG